MASAVLPDASSPALTPGAAAHWLAALCGIEAEHFTYRDAVRDPARHGLRPLSGRCRFADVGGAAPPGVAAFTPEDVKAYRSGAWGDHLRDFHAAYLAGGKRRLHSPVHGGMVRVLGEIMLDATQVYLALHGGELFFFVFVGRIPQGVYYPARDLFVVLHTHPLNHPDTLTRLLKLLLAHPLPMARFLARALRGELRPAFVLGDVRPGHFVKESLGYLDWAEAEVAAFLARDGLLALVPDWCAMDPLDLFPALRRADILMVNSARAGLRFVEMGIDAHRVIRTKGRVGSGWLRRRIGLGDAAPAAPRDAARFRVMISLDAERQRILNQVEAFRFVLRRLGTACAGAGLALEVVWDGWTMSHVPNEKDRVVLARIEALVAEITGGAGVAIAAQHRVFGRSFTAKLPEIAPCDLVLVTQGTGALMPSWLLERPTIVYHAAQHVKNRIDLADHGVFQLDQRAILEEPPTVPPQGPRFAIALWGLDDALVRAAGDRLGLVPELPVPVPLPDQVTTKAGTA
jgi:hypothetical protein